MSSEKAGRNTKKSWIIFGWILSCICFLFFGLSTFQQFYLERAEILGARKALAEQPVVEDFNPAELGDHLVGPAPESSVPDKGFEIWKKEMALKSIPTVELKWIFLSLLAGLISALISWLLTAGLIFGWWFILDRIQDISQATRSRSS